MPPLTGLPTVRPAGGCAPAVRMSCVCLYSRRDCVRSHDVSVSNADRADR